MRTIPLSNGLNAIVDDDWYEMLSMLRWHLRKRQYAYSSLWLPETRTRKNEYMHRVIIDAPSGMDVDHINGDGLDNRRANLRFCTNSQNQMNKKKQKGSGRATSKYKGVHWNNRDMRWVAKICVRKIPIDLGRYKTEISAALAYNTAAKKYYGDFPILNIIPEPAALASTAKWEEK